MPRTTTEKRARIVALLETGRTVRSVASSEGIHYSTVARIRQRYLNTWLYKDKHRNGRPRLTGERAERMIVRLIKSGTCVTAVQVQKHLKNFHGIDMSVQTVRNILHRHGYVGRVKVKKPYLKKTHRKVRLAFAKKYKDWTSEDWRKVVWSDESKFNVFGSDGKEYCWRKPGEPLRDEHIKPTVKFGGGSVMVWGCMTYQGIGYLCKIDGGLDAKLYRRILNDEFMETLKYYKMDKKDIIFQHDNDPKHTANLTRAWIQRRRLSVLDWPAQSPDLNPIEHMWDLVDRRLRKLPELPTSRKDLWEKIQDVWNEIEAMECTKLVDTMPQRIQAVLKARGGYTRW